MRISCWLTIALCSGAGAQTASPDAARFDERIQAALASSGAPSVSVAVVTNKELVYAKAFGRADTAKDAAATADTRYAVGSISKQFTTVALLLMEEQGRLSLDDKVSKYFPQLTRASEVTIRELLSHTSGYEDYAPQDYMIPEWTRATSPQEILHRWAEKPLDFDPGTKWQYSNTNYVLAGEIFEKVSGRHLVDFLREKIFQPLGMTTAGDCFEDAHPGDAVAYTRYALGPPRPALREGKGWYFAAGELCMTPSDLARWDIAFLDHRILSAASYEEFTREVKLKDGKPTHYALGLDVGDFEGTPMISHGGEVSGFLAENQVFPAKGAAVVALSNEDGVNLVGPLAQQVARLALAPAHAEASQAEIAQIRSILEGLQEGRIDRSLFTANANSYFSDVALADYRDSLSALGKLVSVTKRGESLRGGMIHRSYRAQFEKKTVLLNNYVLTDGKIEQFMVEDQI